MKNYVEFNSLPIFKACWASCCIFWNPNLLNVPSHIPIPSNGHPDVRPPSLAYFFHAYPPLEHKQRQRRRPEGRQRITRIVQKEKFNWFVKSWKIKVFMNIFLTVKYCMLKVFDLKFWRISEENWSSRTVSFCQWRRSMLDYDLLLEDAFLLYLKIFLTRLSQRYNKVFFLLFNLHFCIGKVQNGMVMGAGSRAGDWEILILIIYY